MFSQEINNVHCIRSSMRSAITLMKLRTRMIEHDFAAASISQNLCSSMTRDDTFCTETEGARAVSLKDVSKVKCVWSTKKFFKDRYFKLEDVKQG